MAEKTVPQTKIGNTNRAAGQVLSTPIRPKALIHCLSTGKDPGHMVPRTGHGVHGASPTTSLYLYYDIHGVLIYLGITGRGIARNQEHDARAEWWPFVARQDVEHFPTRIQAAARERELIKLYHPPFNRQHNPYYAETRAEYLASAPLLTADPADLARSLDGRLPVRVVEQTESRVLLCTQLEHASIAKLVRPIAANECVYVAGHSARASEILHHPGRLLISVRPRTTRFPPIESGRIGIKFDTVKPLVFRLATVHVIPVPNLTVSVVAI